MRSVRTFIVRVLLDPAEPNALRGAVQVMPVGRREPFTDAQSLLDMMHRLASPQGGAVGGENDIGEETDA